MDISLNTAISPIVPNVKVALAPVVMRMGLSGIAVSTELLCISKKTDASHLCVTNTHLDLLRKLDMSTSY